MPHLRTRVVTVVPPEVAEPATDWLGRLRTTNIDFHFSLKNVLREIPFEDQFVQHPLVGGIQFVNSLIVDGFLGQRH